MPAPVSFQDLRDPQKAALKEWLANVEEDDPCIGPRHIGLWIYGARRRQGTSTIGEIVWSKMSKRTYKPHKIPCLNLVDRVRESWTLDTLVRHNPTDYDLGMDSMRAQMFLDELWDADFLWLDDLHEETIDIPFWRKHIQPRLERRLKDGRPTMVCTDMAPNNPDLDGLLEVIEDMFVTCYAER